MKKITISLFLMSTIALFGQTHFIGIKSGINNTNIKSGSLVLMNEYRHGFVGGLTYDYKIKNQFNIGAELLYAQKGYNSDLIFTNEIGIPTGKSVTIKYKYDYLSLTNQSWLFNRKYVQRICKSGFCIFSIG